MFKSILFIIFLVGHSVLAEEVCKNMGNDPLFEQILAELHSCNKHDVHITFDDGPSLDVTGEILKKLKKREVKATFFVTTTLLEKDPNLRKLVAQELEDKHTVGSHGYEHKPYDLRLVNGQPDNQRLSEAEGKRQIALSVDLLNQATGGEFGRQQHKLFRFPYGRGAMPSAGELNYMEDNGQIVFRSKDYSKRLLEYRQWSPAVGKISQKGFSHLGWNHDSQDFQYGASNNSAISVKEYTTENLKRLCKSRESKQVALFHDIKAINVRAIPLIIDIGRCLGLNFISSEEMMRKSDPLMANGVLIPKDFQLKGSVNKPNDALETIIQTLSAPKTCQLISPPTHQTCTSSKGIIYKEGEGEDSICIKGKWENRAKLILEGKRHLIKE